LQGLIYQPSLQDEAEEKLNVERAIGEIDNPEHQHQVMKNLRIILEKEETRIKDFLIKNKLPCIIRNLSASLKPTNYELAQKLAA
jgi:uncharacterized protein YehS (DUF1456 family)